MATSTPQDLLAFLSQFVTENKRSRFEDVLADRTRYITVVLEDIYQPQNASATVRSCDCFGIQDLHIVENRNTYQLNPDVTLGSSQWVSLHRYREPGQSNTRACLEKLRQQGYQLVATSPHKDDYLISELPLDRKTALLFGTEETGLTPEALELADRFVKIPMYGFTESFNISVSVAICLYETIQRLRQSDISWHLTDAEKQALRLDWTREVLKKRITILESEYHRLYAAKSP